MKTRNYKFKIFLLTLLTIMSLTAKAQGMANTAFKSGEILTYNLYFNWKFIWIKAGNASLSTITTRYNGSNCYRSSLTCRTNARADKFYTIRDNITTFCTGNLVPQFYRKNTHEGDRRNVDEVTYKWHSANKCDMKLHRRKNDGSDHYKNVSMGNSFDMLSLFLRARSWKFDNWKKGHRVAFHMVSGKEVNPAYVQYHGKENVSADNGKSYRCLKISYYENEGKGYKKIATFYITDDMNRIPILIDLNLRFGSAKAKVVNIRGNRYPVKA